MSKNIVIYTGIFGGHGRGLKIKIPGNLDYYDFVPFLGGGDRMDARKVKHLPHKYLSEYEISMWIDGDVEILKIIHPMIEGIMKKTNFACLAHPQDKKNLTIYQEAQRCITFRRGCPHKVKAQADAYKKEGCPADSPVISSTILIRRHNAPEIIKFSEAWWKEIQKRSSRDQVSFPYVAWKQKLHYIKIYTSHKHKDALGVEGADWFKKSY